MNKASNESIRVEIENIPADMDSLVKRYITVQELREKTSRKERKWRNDTFNIVNSNNNFEIKQRKLEQSLSDKYADVSATVKFLSVRKHEMSDVQSSRADLSHKQWNKTLTEIGNYADNFSCWITEHSRNSLMKNIENHDEECKKVGKDLELLKEELSIMRDKLDADCIQANVDIGDLPNINNVMSTIKMAHNTLMHSIRLEEYLRNKIENKIQQSNNSIHKIKRKINIF